MSVHKRTRRRVLVASAAAVTLAAVAAPLRAATPEVIYDLRVAGTSYGSGKSAPISTASSAVNLELFALVKDPDLTASNTGFNSAQGLWTSSNGGLKGNLTAALTLLTKFGPARNLYWGLSLSRFRLDLRPPGGFTTHCESTMNSRVERSPRLNQHHQRCHYPTRWRTVSKPPGHD